jgi:mannose-6-phosphate isomerase
VLALECPIQPYAWGSRTTIARLQGRATPSPGPEAELWVGAHHRAPARVAGAGTLLDVIAADAERELGPASVAAFGPVLPFLLKILAVDAPLSLQAHPSRAQAERGHAAEEQAGVPLDAPHRCYVDSWPKPELLVALTPFTALSGLRDATRTADVLDRLGVPALAPVAERLRAGGAAAVAETLAALLRGSTVALDAADVTAIVAELGAAAKAAAARLGADGTGDPIDADAAALEPVAAAFPDDRGVLAAVLLNVVRLEPGEAVYLPAGNLHAYLDGVGVEVMANSDNVLRGGLTGKHVDVDALLAVLDPTCGEVAVVRPDRVGAELVYPVPAPEFRLSRIDVGQADVTLDRRGAQLLLCVAGEVTARAGAEALRVRAGAAAYVSATEPAVTLRGGGAVFRATAGL